AASTETASRWPTSLPPSVRAATAARSQTASKWPTSPVARPCGIPSTPTVATCPSLPLSGAPSSPPPVFLGPDPSPGTPGLQHQHTPGWPTGIPCRSLAVPPPAFPFTPALPHPWPLSPVLHGPRWGCRPSLPSLRHRPHALGDPREPSVVRADVVVGGQIALVVVEVAGDG